jgi:anti-sigma B factor antagonist
MARLDVGSTSDMTFDVREGEDGSVTVTVRGELDITNIDRLASAVAPVIQGDPARLIVDVGDLAFADSSAIALWVQWATSGPEFELRNVPGLLRRVVESMGLTETLNLAR